MFLSSAQLQTARHNVTCPPPMLVPPAILGVCYHGISSRDRCNTQVIMEEGPVRSVKDQQNDGDTILLGNAGANGVLTLLSDRIATCRRALVRRGAMPTCVVFLRHDATLIAVNCFAHPYAGANPLCVHLQLVNYPDYWRHDVPGDVILAGPCQAAVGGDWRHGPLCARLDAVQLYPPDDMGSVKHSAGFIVHVMFSM